MPSHVKLDPYCKVTCKLWSKYPAVNKTLKSDKWLHCKCPLHPQALSMFPFHLLIGPVDVCERDTFNASCPTGHVILIHDAIYGRMTSSRCIQNSVPDGSCDSDVMRTLDGLCSGRQNCQVPGIHPDLMFSKVCYESTAYLRASYQCIKGNTLFTAID